MIEKIHQKLSDSKVARWSVLALAAFTMLCGYFLTDVMAPLKPMLEEQLSWTSTEYGWFTSAYGWFNVFLFMLIIGGIVLDKMGVRFTGVASCILMIIGCSIKYYAISDAFTMEGELFGWKAQVMVAALGYAIFGVGVETAGITVSKMIVRWLWAWRWLRLVWVRPWLYLSRFPPPSTSVVSPLLSCFVFACCVSV